MSAAAVIKAFSLVRFRWNDEKDLQDGIERVLGEACLPYEREVHLGNAGIIDFMVEVPGERRCGVEVKIKGQRNQVLAQLRRYADRPEVQDLVLVTGRLQLKYMPKKVGNTPLFVFPLTRSLF